MNRKHQRTFLREGTEQITELNNALLALEEHPEDEAVMDRCFRCAHTLKGNFAAQGYGDASELAHAMEDLLDDVRDGERPVEPDLMDGLFAGVDALEVVFDQIEADEDPDAAEDLVPRLRGLREDADGTEQDVGEGTSDDRSADDRPDAEQRDGPPADPPQLEGLQTALERTDVARASVELAPSEVPGADGMLVLERLADAFDVVDTSPSTEQVHAGEHDGHVDVFVEGTDEDAVREALTALQPVESASVTTVGDVDFGSDLPQDGALAGTASGGPAAGGEAAAGTGHDEGEAADGNAAGDGTDAGDRTTSSAEGAVARIRARLAGVAAAFWRLLGGPAGQGAGGTGTTGGSQPASDGGDTVGARPAAGGTGAVQQDAGPTAETGPVEDAGQPDADDGAPGPGTVTTVDDVSTVRVDVEQLDELYGLVERLVTSRIKLRNTFEAADVDPGRDLEELDKTTNSLQDTVMDMRLVPMKTVVGRFPRTVRDLARDQGKEVAIELSGTDVELDRRILDRISDPLVHLVRNAVDHGIEPPDERERADKPREGQIELTARRERDTVVVRIADDGRGIDPEGVRETALESGIRTERELDAMDDSSVYDLVFHPGFSTTEEVTEVSGRGVGMDVVHNTVSRLDGTVSVESTPGEGTEVTLRLPVSVAIVKVLFVEVGGDRFGIPIKKIARVTHFEDTETVNGTEVVEHGDGLTPVVRLHEALDTVSGTAAEADDGMLVRIQASERPISLYCDAIVDYEEVVVKPLDGVLSGTPGLSGTAVLGEGDIVPVIDVMTI